MSLASKKSTATTTAITKAEPSKKLLSMIDSYGTSLKKAFKQHWRSRQEQKDDEAKD
jgi:hypothetical protein